MDMVVEEMPEIRPDHKPVKHIRRQGNQKQPVMQITKPPHNASSANPEVMAISALMNKIIYGILRRETVCARKNFARNFGERFARIKKARPVASL